LDANVVLGVLGMRHKGLDQEIPQHAVNGLDTLFLLCASGNPGSSLWPALVEAQETTLASPLDQLIGLCDELGSGSKQPRVLGLDSVENTFDISILGEVERSKLGRWVVGLWWGQR
jgi:hypothetical protein